MAFHASGWMTSLPGTWPRTHWQVTPHEFACTHAAVRLRRPTPGTAIRTREYRAARRRAACMSRMGTAAPTRDIRKCARGYRGMHACVCRHGSMSSAMLTRTWSGTAAWPAAARRRAVGCPRVGSAHPRRRCRRRIHGCSGARRCTGAYSGAGTATPERGQIGWRRWAARHSRVSTVRPARR